MKFVANAARCFPRVQQGFAFVESVLVFHPLMRTNLEFHRFLFELAVLRHDDRSLACPTRRRRSKRLNFLARDTKLEESKARAGPHGINAVFRGQDKHHQNQPRGQQSRSGCNGNSVLSLDHLFVLCCGRHNVDIQYPES